MKKTLTCLLAATTITVAMAATATDASAQWRGRGWGGGWHGGWRGGGWGPGVAAGVVGGAVIAGAIIASGRRATWSTPVTPSRCTDPAAIGHPSRCTTV